MQAITNNNQDEISFSYKKMTSYLRLHIDIDPGCLYSIQNCSLHYRLEDITGEWIPFDTMKSFSVQFLVTHKNKYEPYKLS